MFATLSEKLSADILQAFFVEGKENHSFRQHISKENENHWR